jgi:signal transduction histidine kinase
MKIRTKSIGVILFLTLIVFFGLQVFSVYVLNPSFDDVDKKEIQTNIQQVTNALDSKIETLKALLRDYSSWDETYLFAQNKNQAYIDSYFLDETFKNLHLNLVAVIDSNKNILYCQLFDLNESIKAPTTNQITDILQKDDVVFPQPSQNASTFGLMLFDNQPMFFVSSPILTNQFVGPSMGRMIFAQYLDSNQINQLSSILGFNFTVTPIAKFQAENNQVFKTLQSNVPVATVVIDSPSDLSGYILINDLHDTPTFVLRVTNQRVAYQESQVIQIIFLCATLVFSIVLAIGSFLLIEISVVKPIKRLASSVKTMPLNKKQMDSIPNLGSEELSIVSCAVRDTLDKKFEAMNEVSRMVAHDLRNPLAGIKNATYVLDKRYSKVFDESGKSMLKTINECVDYSNKIVIDLLDFSTEIKLDRIKATPKELVATALLLFNPDNKTQVFNDTTDDVAVLVDKDKIIRVFSNLIKNAFDAMPNGGRLVISSRKITNYLTIDFSDSGTGISKESLEKLWTPFFTTKAKGIGVGLPICKKIVEAHGGKIAVESEPAKGTTFRIFLPLGQS